MLPKFVSGGAAMQHELRKRGTRVSARNPIKPLLKITKKFPSGKEPGGGSLIRFRLLKKPLDAGLRAPEPTAPRWQK